MWFRFDLRLHDAVALDRAIELARLNRADLLPVVVEPTDPPAMTDWGFARECFARRRWRGDAIDALHHGLHRLGSGLLRVPTVTALAQLAVRLCARAVVCESIDVPEAQAEVAQLRRSGLVVDTVWQSSLLHPDDLPWAPDAVPPVFTAFRHAVERAACRPRAPLTPPASCPPWPEAVHRPRAEERTEGDAGASALAVPPIRPSPWSPGQLLRRNLREALLCWHPAPGSESAGQDHVHAYLHSERPRVYKATRNALSDWDASSQWSLWLAHGALSPRWLYAQLQAHEDRRGANESTYWLWFELLWRDHFRFMHRRFGERLYRPQGLSDRACDHHVPHDGAAFARWCAGSTGEPLVDAGMRELALTGWLSNRMRQIVASYLIHELRCDWRAGAAWFESQLLDFDPYSNQGNWAYIAGRGTDPRGGRHFDIQRQARQHDPDGRYQAAWAAVALPASGA